jgi:hypothetical protein
VVISHNIDAWLKTHAAFIIAIAGALFLAQGGDNYRFNQNARRGHADGEGCP